MAEKKPDKENRLSSILDIVLPTAAFIGGAIDPQLAQGISMAAGIAQSRSASRQRQSQMAMDREALDLQKAKGAREQQEFDLQYSLAEPQIEAQRRISELINERMFMPTYQAPEIPMNTGAPLMGQEQGPPSPFKDASLEDVMTRFARNMATPGGAGVYGIAGGPYQQGVASDLARGQFDLDQQTARTKSVIDQGNLDARLAEGQLRREQFGLDQKKFGLDEQRYGLEQRRAATADRQAATAEREAATAEERLNFQSGQEFRNAKVEMHEAIRAGSMDPKASRELSMRVRDAKTFADLNKLYPDIPGNMLQDLSPDIKDEIQAMGPKELERPRHEVIASAQQRVAQREAQQLVAEKVMVEDAMVAAERKRPMPEKSQALLVHPQDINRRPAPDISYDDAVSQGYMFMDTKSQANLQIAKNAQGLLRRMRELVLGTDTTPGLDLPESGSLLARLQASGEQGWNAIIQNAKGRQAGQFERLLESYLALFSRGIAGERGHTTERDVERARAAFPTIVPGLASLTDSRQMVEELFRQQEEIISEIADRSFSLNELGAQSPPSGDRPKPGEAVPTAPPVAPAPAAAPSPPASSPAQGAEQQAPVTSPVVLVDRLRKEYGMSDADIATRFKSQYGLTDEQVQYIMRQQGAQ